MKSGPAHVVLRDPEKREALIDAVLEEQKELAREEEYGDVEELLARCYLQKAHLDLQQVVDANILGVVRDLLLDGRDVDAIAILSTELDLVPKSSLSLAARGRIHVNIWNDGVGWDVRCDACNAYDYHDKMKFVDWDGDTKRHVRPISHIGTWIEGHYAACVKKNPGPKP